MISNAHDLDKHALEIGSTWESPLLTLLLCVALSGSSIMEHDNQKRFSVAARDKSIKYGKPDSWSGFFQRIILIKRNKFEN